MNSNYPCQCGDGNGFKHEQCPKCGGLLGGTLSAFLYCRMINKERKELLMIEIDKMNHMNDVNHFLAKRGRQ